ncbi:hypothetical protein [Xanthomonas citri]|uniref:Uncharacterized protein n=1 Tax=Xanthomonas citri pv. citri TaxID=611301 RepID=A0A0U5F9N4_XANCI|nr:hypothetical protein [Xanthomonas citri]CEG15241.1 conserved hypothetical protein [Xanthomonas citri pv. citri]CEH58395.1 conserved hypothetical protein [Xanthomonas citri pv. citri]CEH89088.1 conserved hypothetical protein [Xanthomonas citri pv. citri]CEH89796.1 conserved hypothetical protein [Xanthomonas citri pv. citri]CEJ22421.1 conserved hypothetical protein [Xanthomonas citri pv. citri]
MALTRDALQTHLDPVHAAGGKDWWLVDQAVAMLERGRRLANKHDSQRHTFYMDAV